MQLLEHFKELTLHPKNAQELKGLILQLAVQGKLTKQWREENPNIPSASELLSEIEKKKEELISSKVCNAKYDTDFFEPLIARLEIPSTWKYVTIGKISELLTGATPSRSKSAYFGGNIKWLVSGDIHQGYIYDCEGRITEEGMNASNCKILPIDSIMIALNGQGKTRATVALLKTKAACNQSLVAIKPYLNNSDLSEYIYYLLKGKYYEIRDITGQKQRRGLNMTLVSQLPIAIPPLEEQKAIIEVVNQLFAEVEQLEVLTKERIQLKADFVTSALNQLTQAAEQDTASQWAFLQQHFGTFFTEKENVKKLREGILQLAVQGKLTRDWRALRKAQGAPIESGSSLLEKIKTEKELLIKAGKVKKEKQLHEISEEEITYGLPEGWVWCRLKGLGTISGGGTPSKSKSIYWDGDIPWVSPKDMKSEYIETSQDMITLEAIENSSTKLISEGSLLIVGRSGILKRTIPISINKVECTVNQDMKVVSPFLTDMNIFIRLALKGMEKSLLKDYVKYGMTVHSLKYTEFELLPVPLPPLEEQKAIVEKTKSLLKLCDKLEQEIETHQTTQEEWMQSCLREVV